MTSWGISSTDHSVRGLHHTPPVVITDARQAGSQEISGRMRRYAIAMGFRMACFVGMVFVDGWLRWALLAFAVFLPYVAVLLANQADERSTSGSIEAGAPEPALQLTAAATSTPDPGGLVEGEVVEGEVVEDGTSQRWQRAA